MSGHSKWANIKARKGAQDALRGKSFTKLIRLIVVAVKQGGADLSGNPALRSAIDKARAANMTKDAIERAVKRGAGADGAENLESIIYEAYGNNGVAMIIECLSDNRNRTVSDVRYILNKHGGSLGSSGSVSYLFKQAGVINVLAGADADKVLEVAMDAGAEDVVEQEEGGFEVITAQDNFFSVKQALEEAKIPLGEAELTRLASTKVALDEQAGEKLMNLVSALEELDDVQAVYHNAE